MIGKHPVLSVAASPASNVPEELQPCVFEYESCTTLESTPGEAGKRSGLCHECFRGVNCPVYKGDHARVGERAAGLTDGTAPHRTVPYVWSNKSWTF